jgi:hypothetical protein
MKRYWPGEDADGEERVMFERADGGWVRYEDVAKQGRALWNALSELLFALSKDGELVEQADQAARVLESTASTFDHNEMEAGPLLESTTWVCAKCGYGSAEHGIQGHPAFLCVADMRLRRAGA